MCWSSRIVFFSRQISRRCPARTNISGNLNWIDMLLKVNKNRSRKEIRQTGWVLLIGFMVLGVLLYWRGKFQSAEWFGGVGAALGFTALLVPPAGKIIYRLWMGWAALMGGIVTRVILFVLFFLVITPVAI